jgi:hypothetical protein
MTTNTTNEASLLAIVQTASPTKSEFKSAAKELIRWSSSKGLHLLLERFWSVRSGEERRCLAHLLHDAKDPAARMALVDALRDSGMRRQRDEIVKALDGYEGADIVPDLVEIVAAGPRQAFPDAMRLLTRTTAWVPEVVINESLETLATAAANPRTALDHQTDIHDCATLLRTWLGRQPTWGVAPSTHEIPAWCDECKRVHDGFLRSCPSYKPPVDWAHMASALAWEAITSAPKMVGPWTRREGKKPRWSRYSPNGAQFLAKLLNLPSVDSEESIADVLVDSDGMFYFTPNGPSDEEQAETSLADCIEKADRDLVKDGWRIYNGPLCLACNNTCIVPKPGGEARDRIPCPQCMGPCPEMKKARPKRSR